jgi:N-succinyldiaminopimelate aminotransferase
MAEARNQTGPIHCLHVGDTYLEPPVGARAEDQTVGEHERLHNYSPVQGEPALLRAIQADLHGRTGVDVEAHNLQVTLGATGAFSVVSQALLEPGDEVILLSPFWPLIRGIINARGGIPVEVPTFTQVHEPCFDLEAALQAAVSDKTVAIYMNVPNNPTGQLLSDAQASAIARVAAAHGLWLWCDEAYESLYFGPAPPPRCGRAPTCGTGPWWCTPSPRASVWQARGSAGSMAPSRPWPRSVGCRPSPPTAPPAPCSWPRPPRSSMAARGSAEPAASMPRPPSTPLRPLACRRHPAGTFVFFDAAPHFRTGESLDQLLTRAARAGVLLTPGPVSGKDFPTWARLCFTAVPPEQLQAALAQLATVL